MIVTIDGPAGAGKSTVARAVARRLGFGFLDTGAMYRVVALAALEQGIPWEDTQALANLAGRIRIRFDAERVLLDGRDVSRDIRTTQVTASVRHVADNAAVRAHLVQLQRELATTGDLVTEGRDQGTVAFPDAECKIFLTASDEERGRRRLEDLVRQGESATLQDVILQQRERDQRDCARPVGALCQADDAVVVVTDGMSIQQVVDRLEQIIRQRQA